MFNFGLKQQVVDARKELTERLTNITVLLSRDNLDATLRMELEGKAATIRQHIETRIKKINGGS